MKTSWTKGMAGERKEEMEREFKASALLRKRLTELLLEKEQTSRGRTRSLDDYNNPNWAYLQADARGYERALYEIISLVEN